MVRKKGSAKKGKGPARPPKVRNPLRQGVIGQGPGAHALPCMVCWRRRAHDLRLPGPLPVQPQPMEDAPQKPAVSSRDG